MEGEITGDAVLYCWHWENFSARVLDLVLDSLIVDARGDTANDWGDIILFSLREFQDGKADVIVKYTADEARNLKAYGELPENAKINETREDEGECTFEFGEDGEVDIDDI
ncbi:hypothetical protein EDB92DRAFT_2119951 [Lactarius akahatsu]|uniref:S1-like domain-containing protein n=1 Tax=Lactarius akahatsu TaxID=416441 RepID=A0AAD4L782_9AGAM|nr:hypothetical protein EDB92DRAFT_2119951 [Lactarius akahatsu]